MSDTLQLVVNATYIQLSKNLKTWKIATETIAQERIALQVSLTLGVECTDVDDKLKHIGHSLSTLEGDRFQRW
jgi:hypothetical protein